MENMLAGKNDDIRVLCAQRAITKCTIQVTDRRTETGDVLGFDLLDSGCGHRDIESAYRWVTHDNVPR